MALKNPEDDSNPGKIHYEELYEINAVDLKNAETSNDTDNTDTADNTDDINDLESNPSDISSSWRNKYTGQRIALQAKQKKQQSKSKALLRLAKWTGPLKKKGPMTAIILTLVGGGIGIGSLLSPALILVNMKEALVDRLNDAAPALSLRSNKMLSNKFRTNFDSAKNSFALSKDGKCNIKCKFGTMDDTMLRNLIANDFKVDVEEGTGLLKGRYILKSLTFPQSTGVVGEITTGKDFDNAMKSPIRAAAFKKVFNSKSAYFLNSKFGVILREKFGLDKLPKIKTAVIDTVTGKVKSVKESINSSIRTALGLPEIDINTKLSVVEKARANPKFSKAFAIIDGPVAKSVDKGIGVIGKICTSYNIMRNVSYATKAAKIAALVGFGMMIFNAVDQAKAGDIDPEVMSELALKATELDESGNTATSSPAYRQTVYGDSVTLSEDDQKYNASISNGLISLFTGLAAVVAMGGSVTIKALSTACRVSGNVLVSVAESCPAELVAAAAGIATAGIVSAGALIECAAKNLAVGVIFSVAAGFVIGNAINVIANSDVPTLDENTHGAAFGSTMTTAMAQTLGGTSSSYGLKAGNTTEIVKYAADTAEIRQQEATIASYEAKKTPFDIYNKYSFLGSIANKIGINSLYNLSFIPSISKIFSIIPKSLASLSNNALAEADEKASVYKEGNCADVSLNSIGINADSFCNPSYVMSGYELTADINSTTDWMVNEKYVSGDTGEAIDSVGQPYTDASGNPIYGVDYSTDLVSGAKTYIGKNDYKKYLDNCANRVEPLGESSGAIEDENYEWEIGLMCTEDSTMLSNFRVYTMDKSINDTIEER